MVFENVYGDRNLPDEARKDAILRVTQWEYNNIEYPNVKGTERMLEDAITTVVYWKLPKTAKDDAAITLVFKRIKGKPALELYNILTQLKVIP